MKSKFAIALMLVFWLTPTSFVYADGAINSGSVTNVIAGWLGMDSPPRPPTQVNAKLWRSGRPTLQTLTLLYARGVRVIIDLEDNQAAINAESAMATKLGIKFLSFPTNSVMLPDDQQMSRILEILQISPAPVLVHCQHGQDRTGLVVGLERVFQENWPAEKAYNEMLSYDFHPTLVGLDLYFRMKVGEL